MKFLKGLLNAARPYRLSGLVFLILAITLYWFGPRIFYGPQVAVTKVITRDFVQSVVATGHVEAPHRISIGSQVVGTVERIPVTEGQVVNAGQHLIELEQSEWQAAARQADMVVLQAQARLRQVREVQAPLATQAYIQAQINLAYAQKQLQRNHDLFHKGFISQAGLDDAKKNVELMQAQLHTAEKQVETAQVSGSDYQVATTALAQARASAEAAHARLRYAVVSAPVSGTLIARDVEQGDVVQPGKALMTLSPAGVTQLVVQIDEVNLRLLKTGQPAQASADAYPEQRFFARLDYINPGIDAQRGSVEVKLNVPEPPAYLRQDMTVSVDIQIATREHALLIPIDAVRDIGSKQPWILKLVGRSTQKQFVKLGLQSGGMSEVLAGVAEGDLIVIANTGIEDGARVRPLMVAAPQ